MLYKRIDYDQRKDDDLVQWAATHVLKWHYHPQLPDCFFVEDEEAEAAVRAWLTVKAALAAGETPYGLRRYIDKHRALPPYAIHILDCVADALAEAAGEEGG